MKLRRPQLKGPEIRAPKFLGDVARDLRDRHLLIPVVALLVAIVGVPVALKSSAEPPPPPPAGDSLDSSATQPAVLAENVTIRDYRERLDELKSKNPFRQAFGTPKLTDRQQIEGFDDSLRTGATDATTGTTTDPGTTTPTDGDTTTSTTGDSAGNTSSPPQTTTRYFTHRIDVLVGPQGDERERSISEEFTVLPSKSKPVVALLGTAEGGRKAVFLVSDDVSATAGDGSCFPSASNCQYVTMREGQARTFDFVPDGVTYRLKVRKIRTVKLDNPPGVSVP